MGDENTNATVSELSERLTHDLVEALQSSSPVEESHQDPVLASLAQWAGEQSDPPVTGQIIDYRPDGSFGVRSRQEIAREVEAAEMNMVSLSRVAGQLGGALGADIPWGAVAVGAVPGVIVGEVIDGISANLDSAGNPNPTNIVLKAGAAFIAVNFGKQFLGKRPSQFFAGALLVQVLADVLPLDKVVDRILKAVKPPASAPAVQVRNVVQQAERVVARAAAHVEQTGDNPYDDIF